MKKLIAIALLATTAAFGADSWTVTLTTTAKLIAPDENYAPTNAWAASTAYAIGDYVTNSSGVAYFCVLGGTSTAGRSPDISRGVEYKDDGIGWYRLNKSRKSVTVQLTGTDDAWILEEPTDVINFAADYGRLLTGKGMAFIFENKKNVYGITASGTATVTVTVE